MAEYRQRVALVHVNNYELTDLLMGKLDLGLPADAKVVSFCVDHDTHGASFLVESEEYPLIQRGRCKTHLPIMNRDRSDLYR